MPENLQLYFQTRQAWRDWLAENHAAVKVLWLVCYRKETGKPCLDYDDAVEEALCFGWIDSIIKKVDEEKYLRKFTPRTAGAWSASNRERAERMIREGKMKPAGLAKIEEAKRDGRWLEAYTARKDPEMSAEFRQALEANPKAQENYTALAPSYKKRYNGWISSAKQSATRLKRAQEVAGVLERNEKLGLK